MAVTDFFLDGNASGTVTIQPASGTVYTFKRGVINNSSGNITITFRGSLTWTYAMSSGGAAQSGFTYLVFSEAGFHAYGPNTPFFYTSANVTPLASVSNTNYVTITNSPFYSLVGAYLT